MDRLRAFRAYDFDSDKRWQAYRARLEIPPGREAALEKWKAKFYKREVDPDFDVDLVQISSTAQQAHSRPPQPQPAPPQRATAAPQQHAPPQRSASPGGALDMRRGVLAIAQAAMLVLMVAGLQPLNRMLAWKAFYLFCRTAIVSSGLKVYLSCGLPRLSPFPSALMPWMRSVMETGDLFHLMLAGLMVQNPLLWLGMIPIAIKSAYGLSDFLAANLAHHPLWQRHGVRLHHWLQAKRTLALQAEAAAEVGVGFQALLSILAVGIRGALPAFLYFQQLRLRFWTPASRPYHVAVWAVLGERAQPLLRAVPALRQLLARLVDWFQAPGRQAAYGR